MPANLSENKVNVTALFGGGGRIGKMDPKVNMVTDKGPILALDSGNYQVVVGVGTGAFHQRFYPTELWVTQLHATGVWSYPTGDGSVLDGHGQGVYTNGPPVAVGSGTSYQGGDGQTHTFGR